MSATKQVQIKDFHNTIEKLSLLEHRGQLTRAALRKAARHMKAINNVAEKRGAARFSYP